MIFAYYNIIWIISIALFFTVLLMFFKRRRARHNLVNGNYATAPRPGQNFIIVDMNGRQTYRPTQPATYDPPPPSMPTSSNNNFTTVRPSSSSNIEPPPPSYQDYSKDYRVQN